MHKALEKREWGVVGRNIYIRRPAQDGEEPFSLEVRQCKLLVDGDDNRIPIMGPSGAGKTTLMNVLAGNLRLAGDPSCPDKVPEVCWSFPDDEVISWRKGLPGPGEARRLRQKYFGFAFQNVGLLSHLTVEQNLVSFREMMKNETRRKARDVVYGVLEKVNLQNHFNSYYGTLSGGEKQRAALVMSLVHDPYVLFADEPTGSLDAVTRQHVMGLLTDWVNENSTNRMLIWVTHHEDDPELTKAYRKVIVESGECKICEISHN